MLFAAFLILDGVFFLLSPYSGRISRLVCKPDSAVQSQCTVTIYGFLHVYRRSFPADEFVEALVIHNYTGDSADTTYGITLLTKTERIGFIHPYQNHRIIEEKTQQINNLFVDAEQAPDASLTYVGFNLSLYLRLLLLVGGLLIVLRRERKSLEKTEAMPAGQPAFGRFAWQWFKNNLLLRLSFYLLILIIMLSGCTRQYSLQTDLVMGCYSVLETVKGFFTWKGFVVCFFPLLILLLLKSLVQRDLLMRVGIQVSAWWTLTPLLVAPLLIFIPPISAYLSCEDCFSLKYLLAGLFAFDSMLMYGLFAYFMLLGLLQWLLLRRNLAGSWGWVVMPLVNAMLVVPVMIGYRDLMMMLTLGPDYYMNLRYFSYYLPALLILLTILISEIIPALYISWIVKRSRPVPSSM